MNKSRVVLTSAAVFLSLASAGCIRPTEIITIAPVTVTQTQIVSTTITIKPTMAVDNNKIVVNYSGLAYSSYVHGDATMSASSNISILAVSFSISNQGYASFPVNPADFKVIINSIQYDQSVNSNVLGDKLPTTTLLNGNTLTGTLIYNIPSVGQSTNGKPVSFTLAYAGTPTYNLECIKSS
jgi:hypothetical protein